MTLTQWRHKYCRTDHWSSVTGYFNGHKGELIGQPHSLDKYAEIIFADSHRRHCRTLPVSWQPKSLVSHDQPPVCCRAEHVQAIISSSARALYAIGVICTHGMDETSLQMVYWCVVVAKSEVDIGLRLISSCLQRLVPSFARTVDDKLFNVITYYSIFYHRIRHYQLRQRRHNFTLPARSRRGTDCNFMERMLYCGILLMATVFIISPYCPIA